MMHGMGGAGFGFGYGEMFFGILISALLVGGLIIAAIRWSQGKPEADSEAIEVLKLRYATGEIDEATYNRMRETILTIDTERHNR